MYWISTACLSVPDGSRSADQAPGRLAIVPRPRGGDWLALDLRRLGEAGCTVLACLLEDVEMRELDLEALPRAAEREGLAFLKLPVPDRGVPPRSREAWLLARQLATTVRKGGTVCVHCRQGIGRSALLAASVLVHLGLSCREAFVRGEEARGCTVPDTDEQLQWVERQASGSPLSLADLFNQPDSR